MSELPPPARIAHLEQAAARHAVRHADGDVVWRRFGEGPPLVLLHGGHGSWLHWARNVEALGSAFELWLPDLPGFGDSALPAEATMQGLVAATHASLDALIGVHTPIAVAGFSFGALVATQLALQRGRVQRLALLGPAGHGGARRPRAELRSWREAHHQGDEQALREAMRHNLLAHMLWGDDADLLALEIHTKSCLRTRFHSRTISRSGRLRDGLRAFVGPRLLVWGEHDVTATPAELAVDLIEPGAEAEAAVIPDAGHWVQYQAADRINALLLDWFQCA